MVVRSDDPFIQALLVWLGIDPMVTSGVLIDIPAMGAVVVTVTQWVKRPGQIPFEEIARFSLVPAQDFEGSAVTNQDDISGD